MDTELARTFLEIVSTGSFVRASDRLNVGQTTVSARIRILEQQLGRPLFVRNKGGATLTPEGERFLRYAPAFVQLWQRARHQVALPPGPGSPLRTTPIMSMSTGVRSLRSIMARAFPRRHPPCPSTSGRSR